MGAMGQGPIPRSKMKEYAEELELDDRETEAFIYIIRETDIHYLNLQAEKSMKRMKS